VNSIESMVVGGVPHNAVTGDLYHGKNVIRLLAAAAANDYPTDQWAGYGQWQTAGRQVRKGEHGTACVRVIAGTDIESGKARRGVRGFRVFNIAQTDPTEEAGQ
jgi:antirestriction protein ArdC